MAKDILLLYAVPTSLVAKALTLYVVFESRWLGIDMNSPNPAPILDTLFERSGLIKVTQHILQASKEKRITTGIIFFNSFSGYPNRRKHKRLF